MKIGIFDSGIGGLTVFKEIEKRLPKNDYIYLGDTARLPYGIKSKKTIKTYSLKNTDFLVDKGCEIIIVACNSASSYSIPILKKRYKIPNLKIDSKLKLNHLKKVLKQNLSGYDQLIFESNCEPKIINQYKREYYENYNQKFRITIDTSHNIYDQRFKKKVNLTNKTLIQKYIVVEFKFHRNNIDLSKSMLKSLPFRISRNSKYINSIRSVSGI